jgi:predicted regulator of Ras-like GTPase activity (Roadblock/LC7/MglB family)
MLRRRRSAWPDSSVLYGKDVHRLEDRCRPLIVMVEIVEMRKLSGSARNFNWLLSNFVRDVVGVREAIAVSSDGFLLAGSAGRERDGVEQFAAIISGLTSLTNGAGHLLNCGDVEQVIVEMRAGVLFVSSISDGSALGVLAEKDCDMGLIGYEMTLLLDRVGSTLTPALVTELKNALTA